VDEKTSYRFRIASFLVEAEEIPGCISLWGDGPDFAQGGALLKALTTRFEESR